jgi:probable H4MPT-linked C1 transfer pathway protein
MTGELCDCYETKRQGVNAILDAVEHVAGERRVRVWGTGDEFVDMATARANPLTVAAANWHALATFAGRFAPHHGGLLLDVGSTTTDVIPLDHGVPGTYGLTDQDRLEFRELVYVGVRRTPVCALIPDRTAAELFATTLDVYVVLGRIPEDPTDRDTADGRPVTVLHSLARLARMLGGDLETVPQDRIERFAARVHERVIETLTAAVHAAYYGWQASPELRTVVVAGSGAFLALQVARSTLAPAAGRIVSLNEELGPAVSACAPAYALAVLAGERA